MCDKYSLFYYNYLCYHDLLPLFVSSLYCFLARLSCVFLLWMDDVPQLRTRPHLSWCIPSDGAFSGTGILNSHDQHHICRSNSTTNCHAFCTDSVGYGCIRHLNCCLQAGECYWPMRLVLLVVLLLVAGCNFLAHGCYVHLGHVHCFRSCHRIRVRVHHLPAAVVLLHTMWGMQVECMLGAAWLRLLLQVAIGRIVVVVVVVVVVAATA